MKNKTIMKLENISKSYKGVFGEIKNTVLENFNFHIQEKEIIGLMGRSGSGKSTIVKILMNIIKPDKGKIYFNEFDINSCDKSKKTYYKKKVQYIPQRPESSFDPRLSIEKNIQEAYYILYKENINKTECRTKIEKLMKDLGLKKELIKRYPHQISGGEVQRFAILRALLMNPSLIILDEATSMLDVSTQAQIINFLLEIKKNENITYLIVSHDRELLNKICSRIVEI